MPKGNKDDEVIYESEPSVGDVKGKIALLREWLGTQHHLPKVKDDMLAVFLHSCYYDVDRAKNCIESYYTMRSNLPEIFTNRDATNPELAKAVDVMYFSLLPRTDPNGYRILYVGLQDPDPSKFSFTDANKLLYMTTDAYLHRSGTEPGAVLLHNMQGSSWRHMLKLSLTYTRKVLQYQQEGNPIRLKAIHVINVVSWFEKALDFVKPFMKSELLNLIHFHTNGIETLYEYIPKECLPKDLGGDAPTVKELHVENIKTLMNMHDFFLEEEKFRVDESQRKKKKKTVEKKQVQKYDVDDLF